MPVVQVLLDGVRGLTLLFGVRLGVDVGGSKGGRGGWGGELFAGRRGIGTAPVRRRGERGEVVHWEGSLDVVEVVTGREVGNVLEEDWTRNVLGVSWLLPGGSRRNTHRRSRWREKGEK